MFQRRTILALFLAVCLTAASMSFATAMAAQGSESARPPQEVIDDILHLRELARDPCLAFDPARVRSLLQFVREDKADPASVDLQSIDAATSAYYEETINLPLSRIIDYHFSSDFPPFLIMPSSIRLNAWDIPPAESVPALWKRLDATAEPFLLARGGEHEEITPDLVTGAYFRYDATRTVILLKDGGRRYVISITLQDDPSQIGRKGAVIGDDADWNHFYSGIEGVPMAGLGWAKSYMYEAFVVNVLHEPEPGKPLTRGAFFKWLNAGWSGINMTKRHHLVEGFQRFFQGYKTMLESPALPSPEQLAKLVRQVQSLPEAELMARLKPYAESIERLAATDKGKLSRREYAPLIKNGAFLAKYTREEREATLLKEYMKAIVGKPTPVEKPTLE